MQGYAATTAVLRVQPGGWAGQLTQTHTRNCRQQLLLLTCLWVCLSHAGSPQADLGAVTCTRVE